MFLLSSREAPEQVLRMNWHKSCSLWLLSLQHNSTFLSPVCASLRIFLLSITIWIFHGHRLAPRGSVSLKLAKLWPQGPSAPRSCCRIADFRSCMLRIIAPHRQSVSGLTNPWLWTETDSDMGFLTADGSQSLATNYSHTSFVVFRYFEKSCSLPCQSQLTPAFLPSGCSKQTKKSPFDGLGRVLASGEALHEGYDAKLLIAEKSEISANSDVRCSGCKLLCLLPV